MYFDYKDMGARIVQRRKELSLTQKQLAHILNVSNNHLSNIENGKAGPSLDLFISICKELEISSDFLLFNCLHPDPNSSIQEKIKLCSDEDKIIISKFVDFCLFEQR
ncbi:MAG: helix-turn-helix transcriptional regulator [Clostridia bacterium]|nr:helix-turn-helix transcriptional regulator [Clostridia bacterium]